MNRRLSKESSGFSGDRRERFKAPKPKTEVVLTMMTNQEEQKLIDRLFAEKCSCIIRKGDEIRAFRERGVADLYRILKEEPEFLNGSFVADKVVGKAAAALMILGGVKKAFAGVISQPAHALFAENRQEVDFTTEVPLIINRTQTDWCPLEKRCMNAANAEECLPIIENFMAELVRSRQ